MAIEPKSIYVTRPSLPALTELQPYLEQIWSSGILTNGGPLHEQFEAALAKELPAPAVSLFCNATIALAIALTSLRITGEVVTTPYSFVATSHALHWNGIRPVFVDIDSNTFNLDPRRIESAITSKTTAILAVHVYGTPCDVDALQGIADRYGLRLIYDAAHAFGVARAERSVATYGDASVLSFHATKVFNTFEGGAIVCADPKLKQRVDYLRNFGYADEVTVVAPGINGKMNEFQAAVGLLQLKHFEEERRRRERIDALYRRSLSDVAGIRCVEPPHDASRNYGYFPILVDPEYSMTRDALYERLRQFGVYARRYFYPLISEFPMYRDLPSAAPENLPVSHVISRRIICLPIYASLDPSDAERISAIIADGARKR